MWNRTLATVLCTFCRPHLPKVLRHHQFFKKTILKCKSSSCTVLCMFLMMGGWHDDMVAMMRHEHDDKTAHGHSSVTRKFIIIVSAALRFVDSLSCEVSHFWNSKLIKWMRDGATNWSHRLQLQVGPRRTANSTWHCHWWTLSDVDGINPV